MRTIVSALVVPLLLALSGCGLIAFDVDLEAETVIEGSSGLVEDLAAVPFTAFGGMDLAATEEFENAGVKPEDVESILLTSLVLEITDPETVDFTFLSGLTFYVEAPGQPRALVARAPAGAFAVGSRRIEMDVENVELKPYATAPSMSLTTEVTADRRPSEDTTVKATAVFYVDPNIAGT